MLKSQLFPVKKKKYVSILHLRLSEGGNANKLSLKKKKKAGLPNFCFHVSMRTPYRIGDLFSGMSGFSEGNILFWGQIDGFLVYAEHDHLVQMHVRPTEAREEERPSEGQPAWGSAGVAPWTGPQPVPPGCLEPLLAGILIWLFCVGSGSGVLACPARKQDAGLKMRERLMSGRRQEPRVRVLALC